MTCSSAGFSTVNMPYHLASVSPQFLHMKNNNAVVILSREKGLPARTAWNGILVSWEKNFKVILTYPPSSTKWP